MRKKLDKQASLTFVGQPILEKENSEFKSAVLRLKIDFVLYPIYGVRVK